MTELKTDRTAIDSGLFRSSLHYIRAASAFDFGTAMLLACPLLSWGFNHLPVAQPKAA